ncbi:hypothetical protein CLV63_10654 [Murinocardiopsis flavida]|uniref:Uncharacterized protein n=1 Tax=Murinocardiopsis flavida TaxID=645275 RepID=A0A2P8DLB0_9ACTN|nr:hypothetical protein [Murinocardiopsis flavida]PSK98006.1 hypothetical protein CLV63_10654 [Murinocardiopsis flavida]
MRARIGSAAAAAAALTGLLSLSGCGEKEVTELRGVTGDLSAALLRPEAEEAFEQNGHPVDGKLDCAHDAENTGDVVVTCTGTGKDDEKLSLTATLDPVRIAKQESDDYGLPGEFVGLLDGEELFISNCFNCKAG